MFGVGVIIGTGIFVLTGEAAGTEAGPAVALSFVASGIVCALAALCYAEFASTVPVAGSAYTLLLWLRFLVWMVVGLVIYFFYGSRHSRVATGEPAHAPSVREQQAGA